MTMTVAQQVQKEAANQKRQQFYDFKKEDKIWLNLKNIHMNCLCKKFNAKNVKYIIVKKISSHFFCLNTLSGIHNVFHSVMLQSAVMNALSSQHTTDSQPLPQIVSDEEEFEIKKILKKRFVSQVCNETDAQLIISKYKKNTMKRKRRASYRSEKIMCFSLRVLVSN